MFLAKDKADGIEERNAKRGFDEIHNYCDGALFIGRSRRAQDAGET
ncbi:MAG: hypothetical protein PVS2B2_14570 [Candidatus Acidiferrum sp.]